MKQNLPEVFVDFNWTKTVNFILYSLQPNDEFILKTQNNRMFRMFLESVVQVLCDERKFYKKIKRWKDNDEIKVHLVRIGIEEE